MAASIEVENLSKRFRLYKEKPTSLKERVLRLGRNRYQEFNALADINLTVEAGQTMGLLGHNGSGKSTLLKCMAGIIQPNAGVVRTVGRVAALLELGAGFHPELTGRENVYLNASILGLRKTEVDRIFDDIVDFAGLEQFIDSPVKHYSSGMYVRLGFAVAINVDPEILLIDEVLSVGDEAFQRKCIDQVRSFQAEGRTIVVVTHAADMVREMCHRAAALDHGRMVAEGDPNDVIRTFRERLLQGMAEGKKVDPGLAHAELSPVWGKVRIVEAEIVYAKPHDTEVQLGEPMRLEVTIEAPEPVSDVVIGLAIYGPLGQLIFGTNSERHGADFGTFSGRLRVSFDFEQIPLLDGSYAVTVGAHTAGGLIYDFWEQRRHFEVKSPGRYLGIVRLPVEVSVEAVKPVTP